jgi:hypothetical protein
MNFSQGNLAGVWSIPTRTLTGFGTGALAFATNVNASLAAASTIDFRPGVGRGRVVTLAGTADATGTVVIQYFDGTNAWTMVTIAAGTTGGQSPIWGNNSVGGQIHNNSATVAAKFWAGGIDLVQ